MNDETYWRNNNQCYYCEYAIPTFFLPYCELAQDTSSSDYCEYFEPCKRDSNDEEDE